MDCYSTTIGKNFLLWLLAVTSNEAKIIPLKMGLPRSRVFYVAKCKQLSGLLFIDPSSLQGFFSLVLPTTTVKGGFFASVIIYMDCYPTTIGNDL